MMRTPPRIPLSGRGGAQRSPTPLAPCAAISMGRMDNGGGWAEHGAAECSDGAPPPLDVAAGGGCRGAGPPDVDRTGGGSAAPPPFLWQRGAAAQHRHSPPPVGDCRAWGSVAASPPRFLGSGWGAAAPGIRAISFHAPYPVCLPREKRTGVRTGQDSQDGQHL